MGHIKPKLLLGLTCLILGFMLSMQFKSTFTNMDSRDSQKYFNLNKEVDKLKSEREVLSNRISNYQNKIDEYEKKVAAESDTANNLKGKINNLKLVSGLTDVEGEGITITIEPVNDLSFDDFGGMDFTNLIYIINCLSFAGAEAISINDERYTYKTPITERRVVTKSTYNGKSVSVEKYYVIINKKMYYVLDNKQAYIIKAIGDSQKLNDIFKTYSDIIATLQDAGYDFKISTSNNVKIFKYSNNSLN